MKEPRNAKVLISLIVILLITNIAGLAYFTLRKPADVKGTGSADRKNMMENYLKKTVGFNAEQQVAYDSLIARHRRNLKPMFEQMRKEKEDRLASIARQGFADSAIIIAAGKTAVKQETLEIKMLQHLKDIRSLCTPDQQQIFDTSIYKVFTRKNNERKKD